MFAETLGKARGARLELRSWWARERLTGVASYLFAVRWVAWVVAAVIVFLDILPETNVHREPELLVGTFVLNGAATLYLPLLRPRTRDTLRRWVGRDVDDILVIGLLDVMLALGIVYLSGGWDSPYYLFAVASLLVPASTLDLRSNAVLALGFVGAYTLVVATAGEGVGPQN